MFMRDTVLGEIGAHLTKRLIFFPPALDGPGLRGYKAPAGADDSMAPASIEVIFEQRYEPKAVCRESRRSDLAKEYNNLNGLGGAGFVLSDCVVREVMCCLNRLGIAVTFVKDAEFDGISAIRAVQGCVVDVSSGDGDMFAYLLGY